MTLAPLHGKNSVLLSDQYDLQAYFKTFSPKRAKKVEESTTFGLTDRVFTPGIIQAGGCSGGGLYKGAATAADADAVLRAALGDSTNGQIMSLGFGGFAIGKRGRVWLARVNDYEIATNNDGLVATSFESSANGGLDNAVSLHDMSANETSSTDSTGVNQDASSAYGAIAHLHVIAGTGTADIIIEHSDDNGVGDAYSTLVTFTQATGATSERKEVAVGTTIKQYVRVSSTLASSPDFTYAVMFARRLNPDTASFSCELYPQSASAKKHAFETLPTSFNVDINNDGLIMFSADFQNTGAVTDSGTGSAVTAVHGKGSVIKLDDNKGNALTDISEKGRTWTLKRQRKDEDSTTFGQSRAKVEQGLRTSTMSFSGVWDPTIDDHLGGLLG